MNKSHFLGELFARHQPELKRLLVGKFRKQPQDAEEIVQDVFQNVLKVENIDEIENPRAYLFQAATNLALNRIRKQKSHQNYVDSVDVTEVDEISPERILAANKNLDEVKKSLHKLPEKYRRTFLLSRIEHKTYKEISSTLGIAESTVEKHIIKVLKFLREQVGREF